MVALGDSVLKHLAADQARSNELGECDGGTNRETQRKEPKDAGATCGAGDRGRERGVSHCADPHVEREVSWARIKHCPSDRAGHVVRQLALHTLKEKCPVVGECVKDDARRFAVLFRDLAACLGNVSDDAPGRLVAERSEEQLFSGHGLLHHGPDAGMLPEELGILVHMGRFGHPPPQHYHHHAAAAAAAAASLPKKSSSSSPCESTDRDCAWRVWAPLPALPLLAWRLKVPERCGSAAAAAVAGVSTRACDFDTPARRASCKPPIELTSRSSRSSLAKMLPPVAGTCCESRATSIQTYPLRPA
mmetsp:Transcript_20636/g.65849  ORF Transcript_20636/g.65849 Transcript_20636/m.65849 type:complete len:304 (+) Transcript_20636:2748-3659(+)